MSNPLRQLKYLPWLQLSLTSLATVLIVFIAEVILVIGVRYLPPVQQVVELLFSPFLGLFITFAIAFGIGALAVYWFETLYSRIVINAGILWALVLCVLLAMVLKNILLPISLIGVGEIVLVGVLVGIFWKGKRYWRR